MNRKALKEILDRLQIKETEYSLCNELFSDRLILYHSYDDWVVFYLDERGGRNDKIVFKDESAACDHILNLLIDAQKKLKEISI